MKMMRMRNNNEDDDDDEDNDNIDDVLDNETTEEPITGAKSSKSVSNALDVGDMRLAARLLADTSP